MPDHDIAAARREITDALLTALNRRHELLDAIVEAEDRPAAVAAIQEMLNTSPRSARGRDRAVVRPPHQTVQARRSPRNSTT